MTYYSADGLLQTFQKPRGQVSTFIYDSKGYLVSDSSSSGTSWQTAYVESPSNSKSIQMTSAENRTSNYQAANTLTTESNSFYKPTGESATYYKDATTTYRMGNGLYNQATRSIDPRFGSLAPFEDSGYKQLTSLSTVNIWNRSRTVSPSAPSDPFLFTSLTESFTQNSKNWSRVYTTSNKKFVTTSPVGRISSRTINATEDLVQVQINGLTPSDVTYDSGGRITQILRGPRTNTYGYNPSGQLSSTTNALSQTTSLSYDSAGRVISQTFPDSRIISFSYDANSNLTGVTPPGKSAHLFSFNMKDLAATYDPPPISTASQTSYTYDNDKNLTQVVRPGPQVISLSYGTYTGTLDSISTLAGSYSYGWSSGNLTSGSSPDGIYNTLSYHGKLLASDSMQDSTTYVNLGSVTTDRNADFKVSSQAVQGTSGSASIMSYTYDNDGLLTGAGSQTLSPHATTGLLSATVIGSSTDAYTYNTFGELTGYIAKHGAVNKYSLTLTRDAVGRVATKAETIGATTSNYVYTYDIAGRLTTTTKNGLAYNSYIYDTNSNRIGGSQNGVAISATYDAQDRMTAYNGFSFAYNAAGDLLSKTTSATSSVTGFNYDVFGNLRSVTLPTKTISYSHDALNRRITRKSGSTITARYLYDGGRLIAQLTAAGVIARRYVYSAKAHVPDFVIISGATYRIITDQIGSVRLVVKTTDGAISQQIEYDEFGKILSDSNPGFQNFGFAGGVYDHETKLVRFGARDYDGETGRWTAKDPIFFSGGDSNLYGYVMQDPVNFADPSGLVIDDQTGGRIPKEVIDSPLYRALDKLPNKITISINNDLPDRIVGRTNYDLQIKAQNIEIAPHKHPSRWELIETYIHELNHASMNIALKGRTPEWVDTGAVLPGVLRRNFGKRGPEYGLCPM